MILVLSATTTTFGDYNASVPGLAEEAHMATNLSLDPKLVEQAFEVSGQCTKRAAVTLALEEFIARRKQKELVESMGKLEWDTSFNFKKERSRK